MDSRTWEFAVVSRQFSVLRRLEPQLFLFFGPMEYDAPDAFHGFLGFNLGLRRPVMQNFEDALGILLVVEATCADGLNPFDEVVGHGGFAFDAANGSGAAALGGPGQRCGWGEEFVPVVDGAEVGIAGVGATLPGGVRDHDFGLSANVGVGFGESDGVVVGLGHFAAVEAGYAGSGSEEEVGLCEDARGGKKQLETRRKVFEEIGEAHFENALADVGGSDGLLFSAEFLIFGEDGVLRGKIEKLEEHVAAKFAILRSENFRADSEAIEEIEAADEFAGELDVRDLVFANGNEESLAGLRRQACSGRQARIAVHDDVGGLQSGIAEEAVGVKILVADVLESFLVGGDTLEPAEGRDHGEEEMEFGVFGDEGLEKNGGLRWIEAGGEVVEGDLEGIFRDDGGVRVIAGEGVPVGNEVEALVVGIVLEFDPVLEGAEKMADVETAGGAHAGENAFGGGGQESEP